MKKLAMGSTLILAVFILAACGSAVSAIQTQGAQVLQDTGILSPQSAQATTQQSAAQPVSVQPLAPVAQATPGAPVVNLDTNTSNLMSAYQNMLNQIYTAVNPSVVNIQVLVSGSNSNSSGGQNQPQIPNFPFSPFGNNNPNQQQQPSSVALGSGFVWDKQGDIVTNNHVVDGATKVEVTFSDGTTVPATVVGTDPDSDLAVIKVDVAASQLQPVSLADPSSIKVGQIAVAIGNPYGLEGSMSSGIISAIGRTVPANENAAASGSPTYSIPDIIQTDASINPGNSGGVLLNDQGQVIGVTFMIESQSGSNSGVGFAIPAQIVEKVIPSLIQNGAYQHTYLGISGTTLTPTLDKAMNLDPLQRGALVGDVTPGGPAAKADLQGSTQQTTIDGQQIPVGGDVIVGIDNTKVESMDDLIAYLANNTTVGQQVTLDILRNGKQMTVSVTLEARPGQNGQPATTTQTQPLPNQAGTTAYLGIVGGSMVPEIAQAMNLSQDQTGVLVEQVDSGSPAAKAGMHGSGMSATINGQPVMIGGDVIVQVNGQSITSMEDLSAAMQSFSPGDQIAVTVLRDGQQVNLNVTLGSRPNSQ